MTISSYNSLLVYGISFSIVALIGTRKMKPGLKARKYTNVHIVTSAFFEMIGQKPFPIDSDASAKLSLSPSLFSTCGWVEGQRIDSNSREFGGRTAIRSVGFPESCEQEQSSRKPENLQLAPLGIPAARQSVMITSYQRLSSSASPGTSLQAA